MRKDIGKLLRKSLAAVLSFSLAFGPCGPGFFPAFGETGSFHASAGTGITVSALEAGAPEQEAAVSEVLIPEETATVEGKKVRSSTSSFQKGLTISPEINLIGKTTDDAVQELDKYIDDAYLARLSKVRIIHGRGTGALKNAVSAYLRRCKHVASFSEAPFNEGGYGVTVAELKQK